MFSGGRIFKIAIALVAASLFTAALPAEERIDVAVRQYRRGLPQDAEYYWTLAAREGRKESAFKVHKLRAFLDLRLMKIPEATRQLEAALAIQSDPFLNYILGRIYLDFRRFPEAAASFGKSVEVSKNSVPVTGPIHLDLLPLSCAEEMPPVPLSSFQNIALYAELWNHSLNATELSAASWAASSIRRRYGGPVIARVAPGGTGVLSRLLSEPDNLAAHAACIASFSKMEKTILTGISVPRRIQSLRSNQDAYYRLRAFWFGDEGSLEILGRYLIYSNRGVEALHVYRAIFFRRFSRLNFTSPAGTEQARGRDLAYTIRELAAVYGLLAKNQDRTVLLRVADAIETAGHADLLVAREATQKQDNRECIYLLSALQPARKQEMMQRLRQRDEAAVDTEFRLVFLPIYGEKGDPPP
jgi:tetratricopeptide (TPR) repeat protein